MTTLTEFTVQEMDPPYRASYPLDFSLRDDQGQAALSIALDASEHDLHLEIANVAGTLIELSKPGNSAAPGPNNYHFELRFRPGVLSAPTLRQWEKNETLRQFEQDEADWLISTSMDPEEIEEGKHSDISFYLLHRNGGSLEPDKRISLRLPNMSAAGGGGTRATLVELRYGQMRFAGGTPIEGTSLFHLHLVNRMGQQQTPLRVGIVGANTILNDGKTANTLLLRVTNAGQKAMRLRGEDGRFAHFTLSFDAGEQWGVAVVSALANNLKVQFAGPVVTLGQRSRWQDADKEVQSSEPIWRIKTDGKDFDAGESFYIKITDLKSSASTGQANLYLRYEDIPGYWDGQFVCTLEKRPLTYSSEGNVGIGTAAPDAKLQILNTASNADGKTLVLGPTDASNLRLGYHTNYSWIQSHDGKPLAINPISSNVGIGTTTPKSKLSVADNLAVGATYASTNAAPANGLIVEGNVGIGMANPSAKLALRTGEGDGIRLTSNDGKYDVGLISHHVGGRGQRLDFVEYYGSDTPITRMSILGGNVGIGTTVPTARLEVTGGTTKLQQENWHLVGETGEPRFETDWTRLGGSGEWDKVGFFKDSLGIVHLRGSIRNGTVASQVGIIFTLPDNYRPDAPCSFLTYNANAQGVGTVSVYKNGHVVAERGGNSWFSLDNISFRAG